MLTLSYLKHIEDLLRARHNNDANFRLCHYFDLIAGTSTGAIIASALAVGHTVAFVQGKYRELVGRVFKRGLLRWGVIRAKLDAQTLERALQSEEVLGSQTTLGSPKLQTGLMVMTKRIDTSSPWPLTNNPRGTYFGPRPNSTAIPNADFPLWRVVRASTAAPHYFKPEHLKVATQDVNGKAQTVVGDFVDGGVSTANNPALQALHVALFDGFKLRWQTGTNKLLLISVGTGRRNPKRKIPWFAAGHAVKALVSMMDDCSALVETQLQWMSVSDTAREIDREIGTLANDHIALQPLFTYQRYDVEFSTGWIQENLHTTYTEKVLQNLEKMDDPRNLEALEQLGTHAAQRQIKGSHFPTAFNL